MDNSLPDDVRSALATQYHPPFTIKLEYIAEQNELRGEWISGQVTYSGMFHNITLVQDPTWDKPLILTRANLKIVPGAADQDQP
jgi:hypothetical protein